jgi:hypothetical protein
MSPSARPRTAIVPSTTPTASAALAVLLLLLLAAPAEARAASLRDLVRKAPKSPSTNNGASSGGGEGGYDCDVCAACFAKSAEVSPGICCPPRHRNAVATLVS